jgi:drug/metabolite transporter (DMT)-like permease
MEPRHLPRSRRLKGYAAIIASAICSGGMWPVQKDLMTQVSPLQANWLMILPALIAILIIYPARQRGRPLVPKHAPIGWLALFALFASAIFYTRNVGTHLTSATTAVLVVRLELAVVFVFSYVILKNRVSLVGWLGTVVLLIGALQAMGISFGQFSFSHLGVAALLTAALLTATNAIIIKLQFSTIPSALPTAASCICQTFVFSAVLLATGRMDETIAALATPRVAVEAVALGLMLVSSLLLYYYSMKHIPMWSCRILSLVAPVVAVLGDHFWLGSDITGNQLSGLVAVLIGAALVISSSRGDAPEYIPRMQRNRP